MEEKERVMIVKLSQEQNDKLWDIRHILYGIQDKYSKTDYLNFLKYLKGVIYTEELASNYKEVRS